MVCRLFRGSVLGFTMAVAAALALPATAETPAGSAPPAAAFSLPPEPMLTPVRLLNVPASFCTETDRVKYLAEVFNPTADLATANGTKAAKHLDDLNQALAGNPSDANATAVREAFAAYKPTADQAYRLGNDILAQRPSIMAAPVVSCAPPPQVAVAPPPPPAPSAQRPAPVRTASAAPASAGAPVGHAPMGPKRTVAVGAIAASGGFTSDENWQAGPALSAMLGKALADTGQVLLVERTNLDEILNEQQLRASRVTGGTTPGPTVKMIPAQYIVVGSVTEFGSPNKGGGFSIGGAGDSGLGAALAIRSETGKISIDLRILDSRTGAVVRAFTETRQVSHTSMAVTTDYRGLSVGSDAFNKTPLGEACRLAMTEAAAKIVDYLSSGAWEGRVVDVDPQDGDMFVNGGSEAGLAAGDRLRVEHIGRTLTDPATGEVLSERRDVLGEVVIADVEAKVAHGRFTAATPGVGAQRGDLVIFVSGP